ncbi:MAG: type secretion system protein [Hyphomicrobiales bacterium]|nr:type secretion system protein [Hyphomicrobiales bacterium]
MSTDPTILVLIAVLSALSAGGLLIAAFYPHMRRAAQLDRRIERLTHPVLAASQRGDRNDDSRKRSVEATLTEAEAREKDSKAKRNKASLLVRLRQADLPWSPRRYYVTCLATGLAALPLMNLALGLSIFPSLGFSVALGLWGPHFYVERRRQQRFKMFGAEFPNAVDVIVRGIKTGLPVVDCLKIVATEAQEPVRSEFKIVVEDQTLGMPLAEAVQRLPDRMPVSEAQFFSIVIAIQSRTGGSLSEALGNLSKVLRERMKMRSKIKAMSAEAKASGGIIAALPFCVSGVVYLTSPKYISLLFTETSGNIVLVGCAIWMLMGVMVMRKMINFDF